MNHAALRKTEMMLGMMIVFFLTPCTDIQAQNGWRTLPDGRRISVNRNTPVFYSYTTQDGKLKPFQTKSPLETVKVIVTLKDKPLSLYKMKGHVLQKTSITSLWASLQAVHSSVKTKLDAIVKQMSARSSVPYRYTVRREYFTAINGMALECTRAMIGSIRALPEVDHVAVDGVVKINLEQSVHQIRADVVQDSLGLKGDSVLVGEIDTGIDYDNPALGGGFGPGFRVIGGHDFANNDDDPMDDNGHGTHVAGIIGADGDGLRGVAPHVKFLAVKVLGYDGSGMMSDVIAGIEYCMDPDGNPATDDAVDIINMSLGGQPSDDAPDNVAVDNATHAGILSVIAAGNDGQRTSDFGGPYETIASPGTSPTALTVGACDSLDRTADFSSRGPDPLHFAIKPEVVAPGVNILSIITNNGTATWSGTSMATPHVTGVAALLKQLHRDWSPEQLKAVIVNSAKPLNGVSPYVQGSGRIDALSAATLGLSVQPGVLSFGITDLSKDVWVDTVAFTVQNLRTAPQDVTLELHGNLPSGVTVNISQTSLTLNSAQGTEVTAVISVPKAVPILNGAPYAYMATLLCHSDSDSVQVPLGFLKTNVLIIDCDLPAWDLAFLDQYGGYIDVLQRTASFNNKYTLTLGGGGRRDFIGTEYVQDTTTLNFYCFIRRNVSTAGLNFITLNHGDARFTVFGDFDQMRDIHDHPLVGLDSALLFFQTSIAYTHGIEETSFLGFTPKMARWFIDTVDSSVRLGEQLFSLQGDQAFLLAKACAGVHVQDDLAFPSGPQNLGDLNMNFVYTHVSTPSTKTMPFIEVDGHWFDDSGDNVEVDANGYELPDLDFVHLMSNRNSAGLNPTRYVSLSGGISTFQVSGIPSYLAPPPSGKTSTSDFIFTGNGDAVFFERKAFRPDLSEFITLQTLVSGDSIDLPEKWNTDVEFPKFQFLYGNTATSDLGLEQSNINGFDDGGVMCSNGNRAEALVDPNGGVSKKFNAQLTTHNRVVQGTTFGLGVDSYYYDYTVNKNTDRYHLLAASQQYNLLGQVGQTTIDYEFNVTALPSIALRNCFLPSLDLVQILGDGRFTQWLRPGQNGTIRLVIFDPKNNVDSVALQLRENDGTEAGLTTTHPSAKEYVGTIPNSIPDGFHDFSARVHNTDGNTFTLNVSPAFYSGNAMDSSLLGARIRLAQYTLDNVATVRFNAGDTLRYTLSYSNFGNSTAKNVTVHFPRTDSFMPVGDSAVTIDSIRASDVQRFWYRIPLTLVFRGKQPPAATQTYYTPTVTWNSGGTLFSRQHPILVDMSGTSTQIAESGSVTPAQYTLSQNYPNPFNPMTTIQYSIAKSSVVDLKVYDLLGREIATLEHGVKQVGIYNVQWDASNVPSGIYFCQMRAGPFVSTRKLLLLK